MRRLLSVMSAAALMAVMVAVMAAGPAFAVCPVCPVEANDEAQGSFFTASTAVLAEPTNENSLNAEPGVTNAFMHNVNP